MKVIKLVILLIALTSLISCGDNRVSIGTYHNLELDQLDQLTIVSLSHQHSEHELHDEDIQMIYDSILKMKPVESNSASDNSKVLTTLNYMIDVNLVDSNLSIESGDDYISITTVAENEEFLTTIHIIDEEDMAEFNAIIEELYH